MSFQKVKNGQFLKRKSSVAFLRSFNCHEWHCVTSTLQNKIKKESILINESLLNKCASFICDESLNVNVHRDTTYTLKGMKR